MHTLRLILRRTAVHALAACLASAVAPCHAAEGVTADAVTFVQTADTSGSRAALARELNAGTNAYLASVNSQGGVHGRHVVLQT